ncbi:hypothetical protein ABW636_20500 [Aquimarina sp. 2201CG1-2-11]|uniref:hypothetical protein n=1 Tax=Aquimarina discodermiae TaxID=3231043 RepID=UPI003461B2FA
MKKDLRLLKMQITKLSKDQSSTLNGGGPRGNDSKANLDREGCGTTNAKYETDDLSTLLGEC